MAYYIRLKGKPFGPFDENQLSDMKSKGKVSRQTEVSEDRVNWQAASELDFLFPFTPPAAPPQTQQPSASSTYQTQQTATDFGTPFQQAAASANTSGQANWFYSVDGNSGFGPVTQAAVIQMIQSGTLNAQSYVWKEGETAVFLQSVPEFRQSFGGAADANSTFAAGFDFGDSWQPLERSVGWIMFMKVLSLVGWILFGLLFILGTIFSMSSAVASDSATFLLITIIIILLEGGYYYLMFRPFWALWKYHTVLHRATVSRQENDLAEANQHLYQYWKDSGIFVIVTLSVIIFSIIVAVIAAGAGVGFAGRFGGL